ncbi:MAG: GspE/PulE family protein [Caldimicrobium sp.]|jgi:type II secretory ATPase GspE/PulE/Tfp pilus assembly ATPase PilB-like protein
MEKLKTFLEFVRKNPEALEEIKVFLEALSKDFSENLLIYHLIELAKEKTLPSSTKRFLLEYVAELAEKNLQISEAIKTYNILLKTFPREEYREKLEKLKTFKFLERFRYLLPKYNLSLELLKELYFKALEQEKSIEAILMEELKISKAEILESLRNYYNLPAYDLKVLLSQKKLKRIPKVLGVKKHYLEENLCIPFEMENKTFLFVYNPEDIEKIEKIKRILQLPEVNLAVALKEDILEAIQKYYELTFEETSSQIEAVEEDEEVSEEELLDSTIVNLVNSIIEEAYKRRASDIHWESLTGKRGLLVRFRVDGECFEYTTIPEHQKRGCISRIKIMANLDIAERRLPQDGKIKFRTKDGNSFEIRVATIPTIENNEDVVMRILGGIEFRSLEEIDLLPENYQKLKFILDLPYGLILCVGPTGSGKTTTLHACLKYLNKPNKKIWTAEDPVEIVQEGLRQVQVNPKIGLTFARVLRSFLRADPDIIMIGETRDKETAHTLIEASLTGHLVLSTLHTNSAPETVTRLLGMEIDPYNFADSLLGIIAQRLAKRLCPKCKKPYQPTPEEIERLKVEYGTHPVKPLTDDMIEKGKFYEPVGCEFCNYTGFKGRIALHEILVPDEDIKDLIIKKAPANEIRKIALEKGFHTLKQDGILKVLMGETTLKQVLAVTLR